jgi:calcium-dependent protein kinase
MIIHRDIKPDNILLANDSEDPRLVIIDFGNSIKIKQRRKIKRCTGTCFYMAPEVI